MKKRMFSNLIKGLILIVSLAILVQCNQKASNAVSGVSTDSKAVTLTQVSSFGSNPGALTMYKYAPAGISASAPLVVALHGCTQDAATYASDTGWTTLADEYKFYVIFPQQSSNNNSSKCFNWFETGDIARGAGEALSIKQMIDKMKTDHSIDSSKVFVTGLSAGAYFTVVMAAAYPDVFAGAAPMAGGPYKCATSMTDAFSCMSPGVDKNGSAWATLIKSAYSGYTGSYPTMSIWAGDSDYTVKPMNSVELVQGWTSVNGIDETADVTETVRGNNHTVYKDANGKALVEYWSLAGMGHGISVDPDGTNGKSGGATNGYAYDKNVWSSYEVLKFWGLDNSDKIAPIANLTSPADNYSTGTSETSLTISATATDNIAVTKVEFYAGSALKATATASPYNFTWNNGAENKGTYILKVIAYDAAGNTGSSQITVINNAGISDTTPPVITADKASGTYSGSVTVALSANETATIYYTTDGSTPSESSSVYSAALTFSATTTLKFFGKDASGNASAVQSITYTVDTVTYTETAEGTATTHYVAGRLDLTGYNKYGSEYGYATSFTLYHLKSEYGGTWVDIHDLPGGGSTSDTVAPTVSISSPSDGSTLSGSVVVSASASDSVGVTKVEFYVDGTLKSTDTASAYSYTLDTAAYSNASHTILVKAYDAAGNNSSAQISVTINNVVSDTTAPVVTADKASGSFTGSITVTLSANEAATIYYTTDGSAPSESSSVYSAALTFSATTTLKFFGKDTAGNVSSVETKTYTLDTITYSETASGTITTHYVAGRLTATEYNDLGNGTNASGINPGKIKYGFINSMTLYKLKSTGKWVTNQSI